MAVDRNFFGSSTRSKGGRRERTQCVNCRVRPFVNCLREWLISDSTQYVRRDSGGNVHGDPSAQGRLGRPVRSADGIELMIADARDPASKDVGLLDRAKLIRRPTSTQNLGTGRVGLSRSEVGND